MKQEREREPFRHDVLGPLEAPRTVRKAVILAAGRGRRMGAQTRTCPKAALQVDGHSLIDWQIAALRIAGVEEVAVVTGHAPDALAGRDVTYIHNPSWAFGTQVDSLLCARGWIGDDAVIVSYGDILYAASAALALLERPGDIIIAYDADHRWLWKERFGNWLKDSETFRLGPGQVLTDIGGKPHNIDEIDGQFMGLMLLTAHGLTSFIDRFRSSEATLRARTDFTCMLALLLKDGVRIDTAVNILPWMEIDSPRDLALAIRMAKSDDIRLLPAQLTFPGTHDPYAGVHTDDDVADVNPGDKSVTAPGARLVPSSDYGSVVGGLAIVNWGRSGSTLLQSLFDGHPQILSTPNFYSRQFFEIWAREISILPQERRIEQFVAAVRQWWDTGYVDAAAGLHQLGPQHDELAGVSREAFVDILCAILARRPITRRALFIGVHLAYSMALDRQLADKDVRVLFPIHSEPRGIACALLEDLPRTSFVHTLRHPAANIRSLLKHWRLNRTQLKTNALGLALATLLLQREGSGTRGRTLFGIKPYLRYLTEQRKCTYVRQEDMKRSPELVMAQLATWLNLRWHSTLLTSTWDGKKAWSRPESRMSDPDCASSNLTPGLEELTRALASTLGYQRGGEQSARSPIRIPGLTSVSLLLHAHTSAANLRLREADIAYRISKYVGAAKTLQLTLRRERLRTHYEQLNHGAQLVRRNLPASSRHKTVRAILVLAEPIPTARAQALRAPTQAISDLTLQDRIEARYTDEIWTDAPNPLDSHRVPAAMIIARVLVRAHAFLYLFAALCRMPFLRFRFATHFTADLADINSEPIASSPCCNSPIGAPSAQQKSGEAARFQTARHAP